LFGIDDNRFYRYDWQLCATAQMCRLLENLNQGGYMEDLILKPVNNGNGDVYPFRFEGGAHKCENLLVFPMGSVFMWEFMRCAREIGLGAADLLSIPAFSKRVIEDSYTAISAIDVGVGLHGISKITILQTRDYHHRYFGKERRFMESIDCDAYHKKSLIACSRKLRKKYPNLEVEIIYMRHIEGKYVVFSKIEESGVERPMHESSYQFSPCDGVIVTCMDFRLWWEVISYAWRSMDIRRPAIISIAGSIKNIIAKKATAMKALKVALSIYATEGQSIVLNAHSQCGAYLKEVTEAISRGGNEKDFMAGQLSEAEEIVSELYDNPIHKLYTEISEKNATVLFQNVA